jgi:hypothetical protein
MKLPRMRALTVTAASLAMVTAVSASAATAEAAPAAHVSHVATATASKPQGRMTAPVTGTFTNKLGRGTFHGKFVPKKFAVTNGVLHATGLLKGTLKAANGKKLGTVHRTITLPVDTKRAAGAGAKPVCSILNLHLGPLHLNLLGLAVHLNRMHLTITAILGAGHLLGNLLCAIASLLNGSGHLGKAAKLLNKALTLV